MCKFLKVEDFLNVVGFRIFWEVKLTLINYSLIGRFNITELVLSAWLCTT